MAQFRRNHRKGQRLCRRNDIRQCTAERQAVGHRDEVQPFLLECHRRQVENLSQQVTHRYEPTRHHHRQWFGRRVFTAYETEPCTSPIRVAQLR